MFCVCYTASSKAVKEYEKYCAPLLHLAGISVSLLTTNKETDAISLTAKVPANVDAVVIAGGDGTISEVNNFGLLLGNNYVLSLIIFDVKERSLCYWSSGLWRGLQ